MPFIGLISAFFLVFLSSPHNLYAGQTEKLEIFKFSLLPGDTSFAILNQLIKKELEYDLTASNFQIIAVDREFSEPAGDTSFPGAGCRIAVYGSIQQNEAGKKTLVCVVRDLKTREKQEKSLSVADMAAEEAAQIVVIKVRDYLDGSFFGKLNVTSEPLGGQIILDGNLAGVTPKELTLRYGTYSLKIEDDYLKPFQQQILLEPGKTMDIRASLKFSGFPTRQWLAGAALFTLVSGALWVVEYQRHQDYLNVPRFSAEAEFETKFQSYRNLNYARLVTLNIAALGWIGTGFCYATNRALKKRIFKSK